MTESSQTGGADVVSDRSAVTHILVSWALGLFGGDRFYLRQWRMGYLKLGLILASLVAVGGIAQTSPESAALALMPALSFYCVDLLRAGLGKARDSKGFRLNGDPQGGLFGLWIGLGKSVIQGEESPLGWLPTKGPDSAAKDKSDENLGENASVGKSDAQVENLHRMLAASGETEKPKFVIWGREHAVVALSGRCMIVRGRTNKSGKVKGDWLNDATTIAFYYADINAIDVRNLATGVYLTILTPSYSGEYDPVKTDMAQLNTYINNIWELGTSVTSIWNTTDRSPDNVVWIPQKLFDSQKMLVGELRALVGESKSKAPVQSAPPTSYDISEQLNKVAELHENNLLSDEEFAAAKSRILDNQN